MAWKSDGGANRFGMIVERTGGQDYRKQPLSLPDRDHQPRGGNKCYVRRVAFLSVPIRHALGVTEVQATVLERRADAWKAHEADRFVGSEFLQHMPGCQDAVQLPELDEGPGTHRLGDLVFSVAPKFEEADAVVAHGPGE